MSNTNLIEVIHHQTFESLKQEESEFWNARKLAKALEYLEYRSFLSVINKAKQACKNSGHPIQDHFVNIHEMVSIGAGAQQQIADIRLSRYACYLVIQNGDPSKPLIANGQTYFAIQTRRQELSDNQDFQKLNFDFVSFQNHGYKGLYGGLDEKAIHQHKGLEKKQKILENMGSTELAANLFRATQTEDKLRRERITGKDNANQTHFEVGKKVRQTIQELGGTMPEDLPASAQSTKVLEKKANKQSLELK